MDEESLNIKKRVERMKVQVWSDFTSPECYVGQVRLQRAIKELGLQNEVEYEEKAYQIDPTAPNRSVETNAEKLAFDNGISLKEAHDSFNHWTELGETEGLKINYGDSYNTNTLNAHCLVAWVEDKYDDYELTKKVIDLIFEANFTHNKIIADPTVLEEIGKNAGLNPESIAMILQSGVYKNEVLQEEATFRDMGQSNVPFFGIGKKSFSGIQPLRTFEDSLNDNAHEYLNSQL